MSRGSGRGGVRAVFRDGNDSAGLLFVAALTASVDLVNDGGSVLEIFSCRAALRVRMPGVLIVLLI